MIDSQMAIPVRAYTVQLINRLPDAPSDVGVWLI